MKASAKLWCGLVLGCVCLAAASAAAESGAREVFRQYSRRLAIVRIVDPATDSQSSVGSGFFVDPDGLLLTNYHVVNRLIYELENFRAKIVLFDKSEAEFTLLGVDVLGRILGSAEQSKRALRLLLCACVGGLPWAAGALVV